MTNTTIRLRVQNNYGRQVAYPDCAMSRLFCDIAGTKTMTPSTLRRLEQEAITATSQTGQRVTPRDID